jgi:AraC-like DNA-binding protein
MQQDLQLPADATGWIWDHRPPVRMRRSHRHAELELNLVTAGRASYLVDGRRCQLAAGGLLWLHHRHEHLLIDESPDFRMWIAVWRPTAVVVAVPDDAHARRLLAAAALALGRIFAAVQPALGSAAAASGLEFLLRRAAAAAVDAAAPAPEDAVHPAVRAALRCLTANPQCTAAELAEAAGISADRLGRLFRRELGTGIVACRDRLRLERVVAAASAGAPLLPLALDAGFRSYSAFQRACRRTYGCAPSRLADG